MTERKQSHWITDIVDPETRSWEEFTGIAGPTTKWSAAPTA